MHLRISEELSNPAWVGLDWIWTAGDLATWPPGGHESRFFRTTIEVPGVPVRAWIQVWSDMGYELWINGQSAYQAPVGLAWTHRDEVEHLIDQGKNSIAIEVYPGQWRFGGLLVAGEVETADGQLVTIRSDTSWLGREDRADAWNRPDVSLDGWQPVGRCVDGWTGAGSPVSARGRPFADIGSFDPATFRQQVADFYGVANARSLHIPSERSVGFQGGGYWATLEKLPDGSIAAILRAGACHSGRDGRIYLVRSRDGGRTWKAPVVVADSPWCDFGCAFGALRDGTLIVGYWKVRNYDGRGNYLRTDEKSRLIYAQTLVTRSEDGGETWEPPQLLNFREYPPERPSQLPYGKMVEFPDGTVWMHKYLDQCYYRASSDRGKTWGPLQLISTQRLGEASLVRLNDGRIVAALRGPNAENHEVCWICVSDDEGVSWTDPVAVTDSAEIPSDLIQLKSGRLLLTFGRRTFPQGVQVMLSDDRGETWYRPERFILTSDAIHDHGYPSSVQLDDGTIVTTYYATGNRFHPEIDNHLGVVRWQEPA